MGRAVYSQDLFDEKIHEFLYQNKSESFFLFHPTQLPYGQLSVTKIHPDVENCAELTLSEKIFASMILPLDETVGKILHDLDVLGIAQNTMIVFSSDNGHCGYYTAERTGRPPFTDKDGKKFNDLDTRYTSETAGDIFDGNNGMTGCKSTNFEGGTRIPLMYYWPDYVKTGTSDRLVANYDFMATMADMLGTDAGAEKDGTSYLGTLLNFWDNDKQQDYVVFASNRGPALVTKDGWKLRSYITDNYKFSQFGAFWKEIDGQVLFELYNLNHDYKEEHDLAARYPEKTNELRTLLMRECDGNVIHGTTQSHFVFYGYDYHLAQSGQETNHADN